MSSLPCPQSGQLGFPSAAPTFREVPGAPTNSRSDDPSLGPRPSSAGVVNANTSDDEPPSWLTPINHVSRDHPCLLITSVTNNHVPVFRTAAIKAIACSALKAAQKAGRFSILAYALMPDYMQVVTDGNAHPSQILRFVNGITAHRIIEYLKKNRFASSLEKIRAKRPSGKHEFSLWQGRPTLLFLYSEYFFEDRLKEIHRASVDAKLAAKPEDYKWSSYRLWNGQPLPDEPLVLHLKPMRWEAPNARGLTQHAL